MAQPQIKNKLESPELTTNQSQAVQLRLSQCLASDPQHIKPKREGGATGDHVKAIQDALNLLRQRLPDLQLLEITDAPGTYGDSTAAAVLKYKDINNIVRPGQPLDDIVGRMTITQIDNDLVSSKPGPPKPVVINAPVEIATVNDDPKKSDLVFRPAPPGALSGSQLIKVIEMRRNSTPDLEQKMLSDLRSLGHAKFGPLVANDFFANTTAPEGDFGITHAAGSDFSNFVVSTKRWTAANEEFRKQLDKQIKELGRIGPFPALFLKNKVKAPVPSWTTGDFLKGGPDSSMKVLVGSFQGSRVFLHEFKMDPVTRDYSGTLFYQLVDHFGVDDSDLNVDTSLHGSDSQVAFWVLQRERHNPGHMPYRLKVIIRQPIEGSF